MCQNPRCMKCLDAAVSLFPMIVTHSVAHRMEINNPKPLRLRLRMNRLNELSSLNRLNRLNTLNEWSSLNRLNRLNILKRLNRLKD